MKPFSLNINGNLRVYTQPVVMGIVNATPDSFYAQSRALTREAIVEKVSQLVAEGADMIDVGAYSTRPGCEDVSADEELRRLELAMEAIRSVAPAIPVSVDTFRADVARTAITQLSCNIINDISGGSIDDKMFETVADLQVPYVLTHMRGTPQDKEMHTDYENLLADVLTELAAKLAQLNLLGVNDVIIDPGFGFSKTLEQSYIIFKHLNVFSVFYLPLMVGVSRKSMITKLLGVSAEESLVGTTALNMCALQKGASILRVHDVKAAKQVIKLYSHI